MHLQNVSGGVLGGDRLKTELVVNSGAEAQVTTTSATRVYRERAEYGPAMQETTVLVEEDGLLEYVPDPLIPFAGADYEQNTRVILENGAGLFWWEIVAPGRVACGEEFAFHRLLSRFDIVADGAPIARERIKLEPAAQSAISPARLGPYRYWASFYICRVGEPESTWRSLETELLEIAQKMSGSVDTVLAVSALASDGLMIRSLSQSGAQIPAGLTRFWSHAKQRLYGRDPILPRKIF